MAKAHRKDDTRVDGAKTIVTGQSTVFVNGKLWAVVDDQDDAGGGDLIAQVGSTVTIKGKKVIVLGDDAKPDGIMSHPVPNQFSDNVSAY